MDQQQDLYTEIVWFVPSSAYYQRNVNYLEKTGEPVSQEYAEHGLFGLYHGLNYESEKSAVSVTAWETLDRFQDFAETEKYGDLMIPFMDGIIATTLLMQAQFPDVQSFLDASESPFTEFIYITVRRGHDIDYHLRPLVNILQQQLRQVDTNLACCWGKSIEQSDVFVGVIGWADDAGSIHLPHLSQIMARISEFSTIERRLARLRPALWRPGAEESS